MRSQYRIYFEMFEQFVSVLKPDAIRLCRDVIDDKPYDIQRYGTVLTRLPADHKVIFRPLNMTKDDWIDLFIHLSKERYERPKRF